MRNILPLRMPVSRWDALGLGAVALAWIALVGWTAGGPDGWQGRVCADLAQRPASCTASAGGKDETRLVPVARAVGAAS